MSSRSESDGHASIVRDEVATYEAMAIVEKYECFVEYLYPILQNTPRKHAIARDAAGVRLFLGSWMGHAAHADSHNLLAGLGIERTVS